MSNAELWETRREIGSILERIKSPKRLSVIKKMALSLETIEANECIKAERNSKRNKGRYLT